MQGTVKWFNREKGIGFISVPGSADYFFHVSQIQGSDLPSIGDSVSFTPTTGRNGKPAAAEVIITLRAPEKQRPYYGKPTYRTVVVEPATPGSSSGKVGGVITLGVIGAALGGPIGALIGAGLGSLVKRKEGQKEVTEQVEITSPCIKCGGLGHVTAQVGNQAGFQCPTCGSFWKVRD